MTISEKYPLMLEIKAHFKKNKISISDYLCSLAVKDYTSKSVERHNKISSLPTIDRILEHMLNTKMNIAEEIIRLYNKKQLSSKDVIEIYLGNRALQIQLEKTKLIQRLVRITPDKELIYSKNETLSRIAIETATGNLIDTLELAQKQIEREEEERRKKEEERRKKEEERIEREKWIRQNPGRDLKYKGIPKEKWTEQEQKDKDEEDLEEIPIEEYEEN